MVGRPSKYKEEYCEMLIKHMKEGLSYESFGAVANVHKDTLYEWERKHDLFSEAKSVGKSHLLMFFEKLGRSAMAGKIKNFNAATYIFSAKNKIGWRDQVDQQISSTVQKIVTIKREE